ncbi:MULTISPECIES: YqzE family protein [Brevibacillus]|uniref:YqzE family protein n=2 Tax=Brevibacillus invocatus TaxID=173959 RepID=A0A3M8CIQ7_9BACL|nr:MULTISPECIES: YqzE family protein [Brevibacillus]MCM3080253.1 YqzE family protein [Brevibacillus invocatus]MCM3430493.1 YqzE family protein [Brevibacillus invocatus]MDH4615846.1 YqzE family protein [Brevibacillus sp. AY1]RNB75602.1 YqzE family protein [Brevibacillus invocatus]
MSFQEYLKFLTRMFVQYVETPKEERRQRKVPRESWSSRWFGAIPMSIKLLLRK